MVSTSGVNTPASSTRQIVVPIYKMININPANELKKNVPFLQLIIGVYFSNAEFRAYNFKGAINTQQMK